MPATSDTLSLQHLPRLWLGAAGPGPQTRLFRKEFDLAGPVQSADLELFAEGKYQLWVNGHYVGRGPILHHPHHFPVDQYAIQALLRPGRNCLAVLVHTVGMSIHNFVSTDQPGLVLQLSMTQADGRKTTLTADQLWQATATTGWKYPVPRRGWALGYVEEYDAAQAPHGWQQPGFDTRAWSAPELHAPGWNIPDAQWFASPLPPLHYAWQPARKILGCYRVAGTSAPLDPAVSPHVFGQALMSEAWLPVPMDLWSARARPGVSPDDQKEPRGSCSLHGPLDTQGGGIELRALTPDAGVALVLDLGAEYTGQVMFDCGCPSAGVIDAGWAELLDDQGRPIVLRKGATYADRIHTAPGPLHWEPHQYSAGRYLLLVLRGYSGPVTFRTIGMRSSEPGLNYAGEFSSSDESLNAVWQLCARTVRVGTQEGLMDCPTREQACYIGDSHPIARWLALLTGDLRHWRYLVAAPFARQHATGLLRSSIFSRSPQVLLDYCLLAITGAREYWRFSGDADTVRTVLPGCRRVLAWFERHRDADGFFQVPKDPLAGLEADAPGDRDPLQAFLFIDHPGLGWHNANEPGIDRTGTNAAIQALLVEALRTLADLEDALGSPAAAPPLRTRADRLASAARRFFDPVRGVFADSLVDNQLHMQVSEQTNTWALAADLAPRGTAARILRELLACRDPRLARSGPYFWTYMLPVLANLNLHALALDAIRTRWRPMLAAGATTLWETFAGDHLDSYCHPWSAAPLEFLLVHVLGLPARWKLPSPLVIKPRFDLLPHARGRMVSCFGPVSIAWNTHPESGNVQLEGILPDTIIAEIRGSENHLFGTVRGKWKLIIDKQ